MCKVNYATDLRIAFSKGLKEYLAKDPEVFDPKKYSAVGREYVKEYVKSKILVCGATARLDHINCSGSGCPSGCPLPLFAAQMTRPPQNPNILWGPCRYERKVKVANMGECRLISASSGLRSGRW